MALFKWTDIYKINVEDIDEQHKILVKIVNDLHYARIFGRGSTEIDEIFHRLIEYVDMHFKTEERFMDEHSYSGANLHKEEHVKLTAQTLKLKEEIEKGNRVITAEVMDFLLNWLTDHILGTDKRLGHFLNSKGVY
ncbi:hemerythrin-like metal-binding protein [Candidatus Magnetoovum chiemensis]|nr:hemerythrin-like metal-binding protein [Candidatus Magnetoovum chiemensis]